MISRPHPYLECVSSRNRFEWKNIKLMTDLWEMVANKLMDIERDTDLTYFDFAFVFYTDRNLKKMKLACKKSANNIKQKMVMAMKQNNDRAAAFQEHFDRFVDIFNSIASLGFDRWKVDLNLGYEDTALSSPISMFVFDPILDFAYGNAATKFNHHLAALILKLAINVYLKSPILIFDSIDNIVEPCLIR